MDGIFGIGIPEILIVLALALIILGPQDMVKTARKLGAWVYRVYHSPTWRMIMSTSQEIRELPTKFVREAGLEGTVEEIKNTTAGVKAQLKETTGDVAAEIKDASREATAEVREARQELSAGAASEPVEALPAVPASVSDPQPTPDLPALEDPGGEGDQAGAPGAHPEPFTPSREQSPDSEKTIN